MLEPNRESIDIDEHVSWPVKNMLDAMEQLLTGSNEGFDEDYFAELMDCMQLYDIDLPKSQVNNKYTLFKTKV